MPACPEKIPFELMHPIVLPESPCHKFGCPDYFVINLPARSKFDMRFASSEDLTYELFDIDHNLKGSAKPIPSAARSGDEPISRAGELRKRLEIDDLFAGRYILVVQGPEAPYTAEFHPVDTDGDGIADPVDNCPFASNPSQCDLDDDLHGTVCDSEANFDHDCVSDLTDFGQFFECITVQGEPVGKCVEADIFEDNVLNLYDFGKLQTIFGVPCRTCPDSCQNGCPTGACCAFGQCTDGVTAGTCVAGGGTYQGDASLCSADVICPEVSKDPRAGLRIRPTRSEWTQTGGRQ